MPFHLTEPPYMINHAHVQHNYKYVEMRLAFLNIQDKFLYLQLTHLCQKYDFIANHGSFVVWFEKNTMCTHFKSEYWKY